ncbi:MAG: glycoside hydrolase [Planctomycetes bacterium]|nr:glycoside hydrolase [Planctomycetota bacterium]MCH9778038.1 glycoside hydrolase [Planctomycetota bacterium]MCH9790733.1 glycoside hydrolase [Planctomycetota bacterium]MDF1746229.1 sialidase family protein [Gimesia sp.]
MRSLLLSCSFLTPLFLASAFTTFCSAEGNTKQDDPALVAPPVNTQPGKEYADDTRLFQGIPGMERASNGRLWALWYAGGTGEGELNYVTLVTSQDDGKSWSGPKVVIDPPGPVRAYDPAIWHDPSGRLWVFWAQSYRWWDGRSGVWAITTENSDQEHPKWSKPRRICNGIMMNKPTVLANGDWLLPVAVWKQSAKDSIEYRFDLPEERGGNIFISKDKGKSFQLLGQTNVPQRTFDEHMIVERKDKSLWTLVRTSYGIGESSSTDGGKIWSAGKASSIPHINARFFIRRLKSGNLVLVRHNPKNRKTRRDLTAYLSTDDGKTWQGGLLLDERPGVSYPDGIQSEDGIIYIIYDYSRTGEKKILMSTFKEEDILAGKPVSGKVRQRVLINQATAQKK